MLRIFKPFVGIYRLTATPMQSMGYLSDRMMKSRREQQEKEFKKETVAMANKPTFTLLDYKQRVQDQLAKIKKSISAKTTGEYQKQETKLEKKRKILNGVFDEQLNGEKKITGRTREEIALVVQQSLDQVNDVLKEFQRYKNMHAYLRLLKESGQQLPDTMEELSQQYVQSGIEFRDRKANMRIRYKKLSRKARVQYMKFHK